MRKIYERKTSKRHQVISEDNLESMFHNINVAIIVIDYITGDFIFFNNKVCVDLDFDCEEIEGENYDQVFTSDFTPVYEQLARDCEDGEEHTIVYYWATRLIWEQISARLLTWEDGRDVILMTITNITDVASEEYRYERLAYFDSATGLPNGKRLEEDINKLADFETVALIYFQIKGFYNINSLYGFDGGDFLTNQVRDWLLLSEKNKTQLYKGQHGLIILGHGVTMNDAVERVKEIIERFNHPWQINIGDTHYSLFCRIRIGIVYGDYVKNEMRTVLVRSLQAPVNDDGYSVYDEEAAKEAEKELMLGQMLVNSVHTNMKGFEVVYQPIVDAKTFKWSGVEALCRWKTAKGENIPPLVFIKKAEDLGLVCRIDNFVRETAMRECMIWGLGKKDFFLDVNFSSTQGVDNAFISRLMYSVNRTGFPVDKLVMEITESEKVEFNELNINGLNRLKDKGISFSLDDFGTGYSTFENLIKLPAATLKTEKIFLVNIEKSEYNQFLLKMVVDLAHHLNMKIVCEGVERESQIEILKKFNVDYMQGYYFSKPLSKEDFQKEINRFD